MTKKLPLVKLYKYNLADEDQPDLHIILIHRDETSAMMGAMRMAETYIYREIIPMGFSPLKENKERYLT